MKKKILKVEMRLPYEDPLQGIVSRIVIIDPWKGNDDTGDGSYQHPLRTKRGVKKLVARMTEAYEKRERKEFEKKHKADREEAERLANERWEKQEAERKAKEEERVALLKRQDDALERIEVELVALEKTYLETLHLFELAKIDLAVGGVMPVDVKNLAKQLHHLRMLGATRMHEHEELVAEIKKDREVATWIKPWMSWVLVGGVALWASMLFSKSLSEKK